MISYITVQYSAPVGRKEAGGERSEPPDRSGATTRTRQGLPEFLAPQPPAGAHSFIAIFRGFTFAHPRLSSQRLCRMWRSGAWRSKSANYINASIRVL